MTEFTAFIMSFVSVTANSLFVKLLTLKSYK
jgi:hypothetical protein